MKKAESSIIKPLKITGSLPRIVLLDTCVKPVAMIIPIKGSINYKISTKDGPQTLDLHSPEYFPLNTGEAGGYMHMQNFNTEQGLALSTISCGYKDRNGNMWVGTLGGGVSKYDGKTFITYNMEQGMANNTVKCILEDKHGNMWFGTNSSGVSKYDGKVFVNYTTEQGLVNNRVVSIIEDTNGSLWFSTDGGISKYDPQTKNEFSVRSITNFTDEQGLLSNTVISSLIDKNGSLWFGTANGVCKYNPTIKTGSGVNAFTNYTVADGLASNAIMTCLEDSKGNLWFGTYGNGLSKYKPNVKASGGGVFTNYNTSAGLAHNNVCSICEDRRGRLWFGTGNGISKYDPDVKEETGLSPFTNFTDAQGLPGNVIMSITEDKTGSLWLGGNSGSGVSRYDGGSFTSFTTKQGIVCDRVWGIAEDNNASLWFVTSGGMSKYDQKAFTNHRMPYIMSSIRCVVKDKMGNIWFGSGNGVTMYDGKAFTNYTTAQGLSFNSVLSIAEDKMGNLWFGTYGGGVSKYDGNRVVAIEKGEKLFPENLNDLHKIHGKFAKSFTNYTTASGLAGNTVKCIIEDKAGNMWFGTGGNGLSKYDGKTFTNYSKEQGIPDNTIYSLFEDSSGNIWIGTAGGGVCKYNPDVQSQSGSKLFVNYSTTQGLADNSVYAIVEDTINKIIWFGTNLGLSGLKLNSLFSDAVEPVFENFNNKSGYPIKDLNTGAMYIDSKGLLWGGTGDKLVKFDYSAVQRCSDSPALFIKGVKIQEEKISWYNLKTERGAGRAMNSIDSMARLNEEKIVFEHPLSGIQQEAMRKKFSDLKFDSITRFYTLPVNLSLPFKFNNLTFDFVAIETARPQMVRYQYILEGYDNDWSPVTDKTTATFGNIYEGSYTFKLKACSPDGIWSEPILYSFKVLPPWYRTWWMYLIYLFIILSAIRLFFRLRTASLRKEKELLEQTVIERTIEVVEQKELIEEKQKEIVDSINYAKRIQYTLLANDEVLKQNLKEYFVLFQPKDIVSGDFYWATQSPSRPPQRGGEAPPDLPEGEENQRTSQTGILAGNSPSPLGRLGGASAFYLAICDSTGHGVPGAFMSLLNISFLNEAITEKHIKQPHEILNHVRQRLIESVSQDGAQDGMDGILLCIESPSPNAPSPEFIPTKEGERGLRGEVGLKLTYAAANNAPVIVRNNSIIMLPADKMPIGKGEKGNSFTLHTIDTEAGDMLYFYSDGYADQFGGPKGKKFKNKQLEELLISIHQKPMEEQKQILTATIEKWKGNLEQVDDILMIGVRIG